MDDLSKKKQDDNRPRICFMGFKDRDKEILEDIAERINFRVVNSISRKLTCLCVGEFPDRAKLKKAAEMSTPIIDGYQFINLSEFGIVPEKLRGVINLGRGD